MRSYFPVSLLALLTILLVAPSVRADDASINPGETYRGVQEGEPGPISANRRDGTTGYATTLSISLKAGQNISMSAIVTGKTRHVSIALYEPTGKRLDISDWGTKTNKLTVEEVNATGPYKIVVSSDLIGPFTLDTDVTTDDLSDIDTLEARVKQLQSALEDAQSKLKAAQAAKK